MEYNYVQDNRTTTGISDFVGGVSPISPTGLISYFRYNVINCAGGGIQLNATLGSGTTRTPFYDPIRIYNNTIICPSPSNSPFIGYAMDSANAGDAEVYNNIMFGGINIFERKMHSFNPLGPGKVNYNWYPASGSRWRLLSDSTYGPDSGTAYTSLATMASDVQTAGGISSSLVESGAVQSSQTSSQMFVETGTFANYYQLVTGSSARNAGKSDGTSGGSTVHMGAWDGNVTAIGCDFA